MEWQPIETAPRDGKTKIIVTWKVDPGEDHEMFIVRWIDGMWAMDDGETLDSDPYWAPKYWTHLPDLCRLPPSSS